MYTLSPFDTMEEAVRVAHGIPVCRVRGFRVQHMPQDYGIHPEVYTSKRINAPDVDMVTLTCATHRDWQIRVMPGGHAKCPHCGAAAMPVKFAASIVTARDWTKR